ncbi:hypothetical protein CLHUN_36300 [Ruminiclostridium hungatei]|uniref:TIR domain-containing protein n=1 Tax=Ruminiclostridium hungatei TaxID=48256 RepID=A0A1V4SGA0_RUMHU|nr:toll/interleukin-1 receptor domain-containing protein [Ruminiclostridium hungatei]OPX42505.1 hypothetical protein CLHUN_36300 [Ruminiclostridium hungatei]
MINIFLSCSSKDYDFIKSIISHMRLLPDKYRLIFYMQPYNINTSMDFILDRLRESDLFVLFISRNSLESEFVRLELDEAIRLLMNSKIKEILPVVIDESINVNEDLRIPRAIVARKVFYSNNPGKVVKMLEEQILKY